MIARDQEAIYHSIRGWNDTEDEELTHTMDLDDQFEITNIKSVAYDYEDQSFYVMANRYRNCLGLYVIKIYERNPEKI